MNSVVFFGNEQLSSTRQPSSVHAFQSLIDSGYPIEALVIKARPQKSRQPNEPAIVNIANKNNVPIIRLSDKTQLLEICNTFTSEVAILAAFGMIIDQAVINHFKHGIINIHPSLLPKYRGTTPIETAILNGDKETGVSIMKLTSGMDSGPIFAQAIQILTGKESKAQLTDSLDSLGATLLINVLPGIFDGSIKATPQSESRASYTKMLTKEDSRLDFSKSAEQLEREIRALAEWPGSKTTINGTEVTITSAYGVPSNDQSKKAGEYWIVEEANLLAIETGSGYLCVQTLKPVGRSEMTAVEFINGYLH
ncbi:methionyl-tRNA formyltransferase [Candidatus Saccharibacteria bacterium]|nr:methionyl-tRNA formyltransferase [Candidatus Saccharibacteria bacterium]MCB9821290.1 methionyl-tRNA formyltransferase [Candidatus Nomurabacteria bacterium]